MDANGLRFWLLGNASHWRRRAHAEWDADCQVLRLASERSLPAPTDPAAALAAATSALERVPRSVDHLGNLAYWNPAANAVVARSHLPDEAVSLPLASPPSDIVVGVDGVLYAALADTIVLHDLRGRWADVQLPTGSFVPWRMAASADGGVWVLERPSGRLARVSGSPLPLGPFVDYAGTVFRPNPENCHPPQLRVLADLAWPAGERPLGLACDAEAGLALLSWVGAGEARLRRFDARAERLQPAFELLGARYAYALEWLSAGRLVVRLPGRRDAPAFHLDGADEARRIPPAGEIYPLADNALEAPFAHRLDGPPHYPRALAPGIRGSTPLYPLSIANLARHGEAANFNGSDAHLIDSGAANTVWHRLYAEAQLPPHTGFIVWLAATSEPLAPSPDDREAWLPHHFGDVPGVAAPHTPRASWEHAASELPAHHGLGPWTPQPDHAGLWSVLIQASPRQVRRLAGRYLWVRVELFGDRRVGPQLAALRAYASRFSYRDQYLPRLYRENVFGTPATAPGIRIGAIEPSFTAALDAGGAPAAALRARLQLAGLAVGDGATIEVLTPTRAWLLRDPASGRAWPLAGSADEIALFRPQATPADFLERFLANFEGFLTTVEDRIAAAHLLTDPATVPEAHLDWLAAWIGVAFDTALPRERRRAWLTAAPWLARLHGTRSGLQMALDIASGGGVRRGEIIVLEDFRLRRILATLLGVDLSGDTDPLLPGLVVSGNSVVGDTLILGEHETAELLALFRPSVAGTTENTAVAAFLDELANRATVLVHQNARAQDLGLLRRVVELESPAHVATRVTSATWPFLVGIASLIGVDTYLGPPRRPRPAQAERSRLGEDFVLGPVSVDPRLAGAAAPPPVELPVADAGEDRSVAFGESFTLDGSASRAAAPRSLASFIWRRLPQT